MSDGGEQPGTVDVLLVELTRTVEPLVEVGEPLPDPTGAGSNAVDPLTLLLEDAGVGPELFGDDYPAVKSEIEDLTGSAESLHETVVEKGPPDPGQIPTLLEDLTELITSIQEFGTVAQNTDPEDAAAAGEQLFEYLLITYLETYQRTLHDLLCMLGVIRFTGNGDEREIVWSALPDVFENPGDIPILISNWGEGNFTPQRALALLESLLGSIGLPAALEIPDSNVQGSLGASGSNGDAPQLRIPVLVVDSGTAETGLTLLPVPKTDDQCLGLVPYGMASASETVDLGNGWSFSTNVKGKVENQGLVVCPDGVSFAATDQSAPLGSLHGEAAIEYARSSEQGSPTPLVGKRGGSRVSVKTIAVRASVDAELSSGGDPSFRYEIGLPSTGTIAVAPGDGGGFLQEVLPKDGIQYDFDVEVGWSSKSGLYFDRGGSLEVAIPQHAELGPVTLNSIHLSLGPGEDGGLSTSTSATAGVTLGPLSGSVTKMGVEADVTVPGPQAGNVGPLDVDVAFKPPDGLGVSIDTPGVSGGGFLYFDPEEERYAGTVQLQVGELTLNAVGLVTTELPDGSDGFSLLLIVSGEFPPIQLGFGFTLNAVGGLLGVNRSTQVQALRKGVRTGAMNSVLFPKDPVANAQRIISDLREIFPSTRGQHVFGPMVKGGWGTPTIITASLGVVLELPNPLRLMILGRLKTVLPEEDVELVKLQLNVLGVLNITEQKASLDAALYDSRVVEFPITGEMAMRSRWGDKSKFLLSVGGFNPRFEPPSKFPELKRLAIDISAGSNPRLRASAYFAVTSNTVQVGAEIDLHASAGGFGVDGHLGFDALIKFDPFKFYLKVAAHLIFSTPVGDRGIGFKGTLEGPSPWHIWGKVTLHIGPLSPSVSVDVTVGQDKSGSELPPAEVLPKVAQALADDRNWSAQRPEDGDSLVSLREIPDEEKRLLAHPLGRLRVRQQVVPLGIEIEKFGSSKPADFTRFDVVNVAVNGEAADPTAGLGGRDPEPVREEFAPAQFFQMSKDEKLSKPSFEHFEAGRELANQRVRPASNEMSSLSTTRTLAYESSYVDRTRDVYRGRQGDGNVAVQTANALAEVSAVAKSDARNSGRARFATEETRQAVSVEDTSYLVVERDTMEKVVEGDLPVEGTTYVEAEQAMRAYVDANPDAAGTLRVAAVHEVTAAGGGGSP
jgi:hypothetical protein